MESLGLERAEGATAKASRTARFTYRKPGSPPKIELICGGLTFGEPSRRQPAWRLLQTDQGMTIYASKLEWLELVPEWIEVEIGLETEVVKIQIPGLAGLLLLKLRAVVDKLKRCGQETDPERLQHEIGRLERHVSDLLQLYTWARIRGGTLRAYATAKGARPEIADAVDGLRAGVLAGPPHGDLTALFEELREIAPEL